MKQRLSIRFFNYFHRIMITSHQTPLLVATNILLFLLLLLFVRPSLSRVDLPIIKKRLVYLLILIFCLYSFWGTDWFHYLNHFRILKSNPIRSTHLEPFYVWLINISPNYLTFRILIWGGSLSFLWMTLKKLDLENGVSLFFFVAGFLIWFSYSRATLAMSLMFLGAALIAQESNSNRLTRLLLGSIGLLLSIFLHKSAVVGVAIIATVLLLSTIRIKTYRTIVLLIPLFIIGMRYLFVNISDFVSDDEYMSFVADFANKNFSEKTSQMGIGSLLQNIIEKTPYFLTAYCGILIQKDQYEVPNSISCFANILLLLVAISTTLLFVDNFNTQTLSIRLFRFCIIPSTIILSYCWVNEINIKLIKTIMWFCIISSSYQLLYAFYAI